MNKILLSLLTILLFISCGNTNGGDDNIATSKYTIAV